GRRDHRRAGPGRGRGGGHQGRGPRCRGGGSAGTVPALPWSDGGRGVMSIPFLDLKPQHQALRHELQDALAAVLASSQFILGPAVERFEENFARYIGVRHCVGVNNGTSALHLALRALDIGPGDEVITTPHTWISTTWAVSYVGARPVFVD